MKKNLFKFYLLLIAFSFCSNHLCAQAPTISSFLPDFGIIGSSVTISGTGFNAQPAQNAVYFGATKAVITSASSTSLTVTVPIGVTFEKISVTNLAVNLTAYSTRPFIVTTTSGNFSFAPKASLSGSFTSTTVNIGDFDLDGLPDVAVADVANHNLLVYRNTTNSGLLSFAASIEYTIGSAAWHKIVCGDIDGDGMLDLVVNTGSTVSVFRNTSTSGAISFATKVDFNTGDNNYSVCIGDIDSDGKPDMAVANWTSNNVSVFRNNSSLGSISFETEIDLTTGISPRSVVIEDIDRDGKPDLAVANENSNTVSIFLNTSTTGILSFAAKIDFATSTTPYYIVMGDFDKDTKPDLVAACPASGNNVISVLRNLSTTGNVNFDTKVDIAATNPTSLCISDVNGDLKPDLAVGNNNSATVSIYPSLSSSGTISFDNKVDFAGSSNMWAVAIGDLDTDGKPDLVTAGSGASVLRLLTFPTITSFTPSSGCAGVASVTITGTYLMGATSVKFGATNALSFTVNSSTQITAKVGAGTTGKISITTPAGTVESTNTFTVNSATVTASANPSVNVCNGDTVILSGNGAVSYQWSEGVSNGVGFVPLTTTYYTVTGTDANGCTGTSYISIYVNAKPTVTANASPSTTVCAGTSVALNGIGAVSYTWLDDVINGENFIPEGTKTYTVTGTGANGCTDTATINILVNPLPIVIASASPNDTVCVGTAVTLNGSGATTYTWTGVVQNGVSFVSETSTTYIVTGTDANGCSNKDTIHITVNKLPVIAIAANPSLMVCEGNSVTLTASGASNYSWTGEIINDQTFIPAATGSYTVTATDTNTCVNTKSITITVNTLPLVSASASPSATICQDNVVTLTGNGANTYAWSGGITDNVSFTPTESGTYTVIGTDINNCNDTATIDITVNEAPNSSIGEANVFACNDDILTFSLTDNTDVASYSITNGIETSNNSPLTFTYNGNQVLVQSNVTGTNGCASQSVINLTDNSIYNLFQLAPTNNDPTFTFVAAEIPAMVDSWIWDFGDGNTQNGGVSAEHTYTANGTYTAKLIGMNECDSTNTGEMTITVSSYTTAIKETSPANSVSIFPVPNNGLFTVKNNTVNTINIQIFNSLGKFIETYSVAPNNSKINDLTLPSGIYLVKIFNPLNDVLSKTIIVE